MTRGTVRLCVTCVLGEKVEGCRIRESSRDQSFRYLRTYISFFLLVRFLTSRPILPDPPHPPREEKVPLPYTLDLPKLKPYGLVTCSILAPFAASAWCGSAAWAGYPVAVTPPVATPAPAPAFSDTTFAVRCTYFSSVDREEWRWSEVK